MIIRMRSAICFLVLLLALGCGAKNPPPLTLEEIPAAMKKSYASARLQTKKNAEAVAKLIEEKQYAVASIQLQGLLQTEGLNDDQRNVTSAALTTINALLAQVVGEAEPAPAGGDAPPPPKVEMNQQDVEAAKAVRQHYIRTK